MGLSLYIGGLHHLIFGDREALVTSADCKSVASGIRGSNPWISTIHGLKVFMDAHEPVTLEEGDRYPLGPPS